MIYITSSATTEGTNEFRIQSIFCSTEKECMYTTRENGWNIEKMPISAGKLLHITTTQHFSVEPMIYSPLRKIEGNETPLNFLTHVAKEMSKNDNESYSKKLFRVLCEIGEEVDINEHI